MKKKLGLALMVALATVSMAQAAVLKLQAGANAIEGVNVSTGASAIVEGRVFNLTNVGAGLRAKKVSIMNVKVYVGQLLVSDASKFDRTEAGALASLDKMEQSAFQLSFVRGVDAPTVQASFSDALIANKVAIGNREIAAFLKAVASGGNADAGKTLTVVGEKLKDGSEAVTYEDGKGQAATIKGGAGFVKAVFSMWLGNPSDAGVGKLKSSILGSK